MLVMIFEYYGYRKSGCGKNERCSGNGSNYNSGGYCNGSGSKYDRVGGSYRERNGGFEIFNMWWKWRKWGWIYI